MLRPQHLNSPDDATAQDAAAVIFASLPESGLRTVTADGIEFVICASALTAQM